MIIKITLYLFVFCCSQIKTPIFSLSTLSFVEKMNKDFLKNTDKIQGKRSRTEWVGNICSEVSKLSNEKTPKKRCYAKSSDFSKVVDLNPVVNEKEEQILPLLDTDQNCIPMSEVNKSSESAHLDKCVDRANQRKLFWCDICQKHLKGSNVRRHKQTHTGEKPFLCAVCRKRFSRLADKKTHEERCKKKSLLSPYIDPNEECVQISEVQDLSEINDLNFVGSHNQLDGNVDGISIDSLISDLMSDQTIDNTNTMLCLLDFNENLLNWNPVINNNENPKLPLCIDPNAQDAYCESVINEQKERDLNLFLVSHSDQMNELNNPSGLSHDEDILNNHGNRGGIALKNRSSSDFLTGHKSLSHQNKNEKNKDLSLLSTNSEKNVCFDNNYNLVKNSEEEKKEEERGYICKKCGSKYLSFIAFKRHKKGFGGCYHYLCDPCGRIFINKEIFTQHKVDCIEWQKLSKVRNKKCNQCSGMFSIRSLEKHIKDFYNEDHYACDQCQEIFRNKEDFKKHQVNDHYVEADKKRYFLCDVCYRKFPKKGSVLQHKKYHPEDHYGCEQCQQIFKSNDELRDHESSNHNLYFVKCGYCEQDFPSLIVGDSIQDQQKRERFCEFCKKTFKSTILKPDFFLNEGQSNIKRDMDVYRTTPTQEMIKRSC